MSAQIIDGKAIARRLRADLKQEVKRLTRKSGRIGLAVVQVGEDPASQVYIRNKIHACEEVGIASEVHYLPPDTKEAEVLCMIERLNKDDAIHGILVQLPLPAHISVSACVSAVLPEKDVDGFHPVNMGHLMRGEEGFVPCTPLGIMHMLDDCKVEVTGKHATVVGVGNVGQPLAVMLMQRRATVSVCHSRTSNLSEMTRMADILIAAIGRPGMITANMVKPGAAVIDVGINRLAGGGLSGDVDFESVKEVAGHITPVPGGIGPMTVAMLIANTIRAAR